MMVYIMETKTEQKRTHGFISVFFALLGNTVITVIKFFGFYLSGSSVLFSEAVHSFADTMNQSLLMVGIKKSAKKADEEFVYGYGQERFLWALISACGIFFLGAGVTVSQGIEALRHPKSIELSPLIFAILIISFILESFSFYTAWHELRASSSGSVANSFKHGDPTTIAVLYEDGIALLGVLVALVSIILSRATGNHYWDGIGSIVIGLMLAGIAVMLINKNRGFLIKRAIPEEIKERAIEILKADPVVEKVLDFKSAVLDIGSYRIKCEVEFNGSALMKEIYKSVSLKEEFEKVSEDYEEFKKFFVENIDRLPRLIGKRIDEIEKKIKTEIPGIIHIDIEIN